MTNNRNRNPARNSEWLDGIAVGLSGLCLLHCLLLPLAVAGLPLLAGLDSGHLHAQLLIAVIPLTTVALAVGYRRHGDYRVVFAAAIGVALLVTGGLIAHQYWGATSDRVLTVSGSMVLAAAHFYNSLLARRCHITN